MRMLLSLFLSGLLIWFPIACTTGFSAPVSLREELGSSPTLSVLFPRDDGDLVYFDPLGLANDENFARYREAELKHGRVAMVAVIGSVIPTYYSEIIHSNHGNDVLSIFLKVPSIYQLLHQYTVPDVVRFFLICGLLETLVLVQIDPQDMPGDYGVGYCGVRDKGAHERSLVCELENGRLAMLVMFYYLIRDVLEEPFYQSLLDRL